MAKTLADLSFSRYYRESVVEGCFNGNAMPESILRHDKRVKAIDLTLDEGGRSYDDFTANHTDIKAFDISSRSVRAGALSRFPQSVGRALLLFYTAERDIVVDPFAGHNSRMELCFRAKRDYIGHDVSHEFMLANRKIKALLIDDYYHQLVIDGLPSRITLHECDSRHMPVADETGDFTITSPPYWDLEHYGDEAAQIGTGKSYDAFLAGLSEIITENFRVLKCGAFCVYCINDFRKNGQFYPYHEHTAVLLRHAGFVQHDIAITDLGSAFGSAFAQQIMTQKILPKRHEYALIFRKPELNGEIQPASLPVFQYDKRQLELL